MHHLKTLLLHELKMLILNPANYVAAVSFTMLMGFIYYLALLQAASQVRELTLTTPFLQTFWLPTLFIVPLITMRSFAEERRMGTLEALLTTPVRAWQVTLAKFLAAWILYSVLWLSTLFYPIITISVSQLEAREIQQGAVLIGGYSFIAVSGLLYVALGILASSLTRSQFIAAILSFGMLLASILAGRLLDKLNFARLWEGKGSAQLNDYLNTFAHLQDASNGILDSRAIILYTSLTVLTLMVTIIRTQGKN